MASEYIIKKGPGKWEAKIFSDKANEIAEIKRIGDKLGRQSLEFRLCIKIDHGKEDTHEGAASLQ